MKKELQDLREDYKKGSLDVNDLPEDPLKSFEIWFKEYEQIAGFDANAMTLATVSPQGQPTARIVLLKGVDKGGFEFYTNYGSAKGRDIEANPKVSLLFFWKEKERQVRIEGEAVKMTREESELYFKSRPLGSQLGAWASPQSAVIKDRKVLEDNLKQAIENYGDDVPLPEYWGGYRVMPSQIEFWQGRSSRLHDRVVYQKHESKWSKIRLAP